MAYIPFSSPEYDRRKIKHTLHDCYCFVGDLQNYLAGLSDADLVEFSRLIEKIKARRGSL